MKKNAVRAELEARPWLKNCIQYLTGSHPFHVKKAGGNWEEHLMEWSTRNISEIAIHQFSDLDLDEKAGSEFHFFGDERKSLEKLRAFATTKFWCFNHQTHEDDGPHAGGEYSFLVPYSMHWTLQNDDYVPKSMRECLKHLSNPRHATIGGEKVVVKTPFIFDAMVRVTQVGVSGKCSSTIIDIFPFPEDFDITSL